MPAVRSKLSQQMPVDGVSLFRVSAHYSKEHNMNIADVNANARPFLSPGRILILLVCDQQLDFQKAPVQETIQKAGKSRKTRALPKSQLALPKSQLALGYR